MSTHALNDKKIIRAWAIFDWANSAYSLVISTAIFPIYFIAYTPEIITLGGMQFTNAALYSFAVTFSYVNYSMPFSYYQVLLIIAVGESFSFICLH
ncbi:MAG: hypothetical protein IPF52_17595 [Saprospiraceae bacterium]|nr:hypothetical protein [Saprospiraceae bacterium]